MCILFCIVRVKSVLFKLLCVFNLIASGKIVRQCAQSSACGEKDELKQLQTWLNLRTGRVPYRYTELAHTIWQ